MTVGGWRAFRYHAGMTPSEIKNLVKAQPFKPFRLFMTDGASYEVREPHEAQAFGNAIVVGADRDDSGWPQRIVILDPRLITRMELDAGTQSGSNGRT